MKRVFTGIAFLLLLWCAPVQAAAPVQDTVVCAAQAGSQTTLVVSVVVNAGHSNYVIAALIGGGGTTNGAVSGVAGHGGTWSPVSSGNGNTMKGTAYKNIAPSTGTANVTITWAGTTDQASGACFWVYYDADQSTGVNGFQVATMGDIVVSSATNDVTVSAQFDTFNNRAVTGCTSSTDASSYTSTGYSGAHCSGASTTTFTWAGYGGVSVGVGANIKQVSGGGGGGSAPSSRKSLTGAGQ